MSWGERYVFTNGWTMAREPNHPWFWIVNDESGKQVDRDQYRYDVFDRHGLTIAEEIEPVQHRRVAGTGEVK